MKAIIIQSFFLFGLIFILGCETRKDKENENLNIKRESIEKLAKDSLQKVNVEKKLTDIFGAIDSSKIITSIGCDQGFFGYISSQYILKIPSGIYYSYENTQEYKNSVLGLPCELYVYENDSSHLANICTDLIIMNLPKPVRKLESINNDIKVYKGNPIELWGSIVNRIYIKIEKIEFRDTLNNNHKIEIKDLYLWEVPFLGTPG